VVTTPLDVLQERDVSLSWTNRKEDPVLLALAILLLIVAVAGGVIIHPILFGSPSSRS
jgi:hypothetical protein